jgi:hypothetical protein
MRPEVDNQLSGQDGHPRHSESRCKAVSRFACHRTPYAHHVSVWAQRPSTSLPPAIHAPKPGFATELQTCHLKLDRVKG